jgi:hypothetical protein
MAICIKEDLLSPEPVQWNATGYRITRKFQVTGLAAYSPTLRPLMAVAATDATTGFSIPAIGAAHPDRPEAVVRHVRGLCQGFDCFDVLCEYQWDLYPSAYLKSFDASLVQVLRHYDASNNLATVTYTPPGGTPQTEVADLQRLILNATVSFHFLETADPEALTLAYAGLVNSAVWRNYPPRTWLCLPITGSTHDGAWYRNTYSFAYNPETWDEYAVFRNVDGRIPPGVAGNIVTDGSSMNGNGWGRFIVFGQTDFNTAFPNIK